MDVYDVMMTGLLNAIPRTKADDRLLKLTKALVESIETHQDCTDILSEIDNCQGEIQVETFNLGVRMGMQLMAKVLSSV